MRNKWVAWLVMIPVISCAVEPIAPLPQKVPHNPAKAAIGKSLFFDPILSKDNSVACASCHALPYGGADPLPVSIGIEGKTGRMNSPTVLNAVFNFSQFWNGRAKNLTEQASGPIHNSVEMGSNTALVERRINQNTHYAKAFRKVYGKRPVTFADITETIVEYEKTLITPNAKFDRYLRGEIKLNDSEARGYSLFKRIGCASCHNGVNIGGNSYQKFGVIVPIEHSLQTDDRYKLTKREFDKNVFKVPTLRNIALTAPYFHDGRASSLKEALKIMSNHNLGIILSSDELNDLTAFLYTLTGELPDNGNKQ